MYFKPFCQLPALHASLCRDMHCALQPCYTQPAYNCIFYFILKQQLRILLTCVTNKCWSKLVTTSDSPDTFKGLKNIHWRETQPQIPPESKCLQFCSSASMLITSTYLPLLEVPEPYKHQNSASRPRYFKPFVLFGFFNPDRDITKK